MMTTDDVMTALRLTYRGEYPRAVDLLHEATGDRPEEVCALVGALSNLILRGSGIPPGSGLVTWTQAGSKVSARDRETCETCAAILAAHGNADIEGAVRLFMRLEAHEAGRVVGAMLELAAPIVGRADARLS